MLKKISNGVSAGLMISIGCSVYLACGDKVVGSVLFAVALLTICYKDLSLFTGKVGYLVEDHSKNNIETVLTALLGNAVAVIGLGLVIGICMPNLKYAAQALFDVKLTQRPYETFVRAIFCGVLMYVAVSVYRENKSVLGIIFAVPVFILSGFEHSIADMCYFAISGNVSADAFAFIAAAILGNAAGGILLPLLQGKFKKTIKVQTYEEND